ncbi:hypothetical protein FB451DRAFT_1331066 [Mycena latifolia]|nr:hypothetical protein FB451DRAFT_1331066 [Mycena latifolia]
MEGVIKQLKGKRASLQSAIDDHRALTSPIRRIPRDVLLEIFFSCLPTEHNALIDPTEAPMLLGLVCSRWRSLAYSTPMIWSSLHIPSLSYRGAPSTMALKLDNMVKAWLDRSAPCPLSISFSQPIMYNNVIIDPDSPVHRLLEVSKRIQHLILSADAALLDPLLRLGPEELPVLQSILVQVPTSRGLIDLSDSDGINALQIPTLHEVSLNAPIDAITLSLRWAQLTTLCLTCYPLWTDHGIEGGLDASGALDILRRCPNLVVCQIKATKDGGSINTTPITLPHLHNLALGGEFSLSKCIMYLVLPSLCWLRIGEEVPYLEESSSSWWFPNTHGDTLTVEIDTSTFRPPDLLALLHRFPLISHLRLYSFTFGPTPRLDDAFLALLGAAQDVPCPMLTHMTVAAPCAMFSDAGVLAFIRARMALDCPLQAIGVSFDRPVEFDISPELETFVSEGLHVDLQYPLPQWTFNAREGLLH